MGPDSGFQFPVSVVGSGNSASIAGSRPEAAAGSRRRAEDDGADESRTEERVDDMSSVMIGHPGPIYHGGM